MNSFVVQQVCREGAPPPELRARVFRRSPQPPGGCLCPNPWPARRTRAGALDLAPRRADRSRSRDCLRAGPTAGEKGPTQHPRPSGCRGILPLASWSHLEPCKKSRPPLRVNWTGEGMASMMGLLCLLCCFWGTDAVVLKSNLFSRHVRHTENLQCQYKYSYLCSPQPHFTTLTTSHLPY